MLAAGAASAQTWPAKPVRVVIGFGAGGATDLVSRVMSDEVGKILNQSFVIENKPGASGMVAANTVKNSPPDGYTLYGGNATALTKIFFKDNPLDPPKDFTPVSTLSLGDEFVFVRADLGINSIKDLVAKAKTMRLRHASPAVPQNLLTAVMAKQAGFTYENIPYKTTDQVITALLSGDGDFVVTSLPGFIPHIQAGKLKVIGVMGATRSALQPNVPTLKEQGVDMEFRFNLGYWGPRGVPEDIVAKLVAAVAQAAKAPAAVEKIGSTSMVPTASTPEELVRIHNMEVQTYTEAAALTGLQPQ
jgi:tripartite-type tricarboxylate transporter receptor subunit TctC